MEKFKNFISTHKKALIITGAVIGTAILGIIGYKVCVDRAAAMETIAEVVEDVGTDTVNAITNV